MQRPYGKQSRPSLESTKNQRKFKKTILKQQYENFTASRSEGLDKTYDRCQKLISQLEIHGEVISQKDANLKLLRNLPSAWNNIALIRRNKADLDELSMDDLYNNLKVYKAKIKSQSSSNSNSQNVAFVSSDDTSSTNEAVNTAHDVPTARRIVPVETPANALVVQDGIGGYDWSIQAKEGPTEFALMAQLSSGYQLGLESLEARIIVHEKNEAVYEEDIAFLKYDVQVKDISIKDLKNQLEEALKEKDDLKLKLEKFETSYMKLTKLINSQISVNNKSGVGFDSQMNENKFHDCHLNKSKVFESASDSSVNEIEEENNQVNDRPDLSFVGLDDSVYKTNVSETISSVPRIESIASNSSKDSLEKPKTIRPSAPIIEDWDTDSDNDSVFRPKPDQIKLKFTKINFVKSDKNVKSVNKENTHRQEEYPRKSQIPRDNRRN
ncbi:hypothetical protein Tco_1420992 [Tanacetum coccineum]